MARKKAGGTKTMIQLTSMTTNEHAVTFKGHPVGENGPLDSVTVKATITYSKDPAVGALVEQLRQAGIGLLVERFDSDVVSAQEPGLFDEPVEPTTTKEASA